MKYQNLQFYNSDGYNLNLSVQSLITFSITSNTGRDAQIFGITDSAGNLVDSYSVNQGYLYNPDSNIDVELIYALDSSKNKNLILNKFNPNWNASLNFVDVEVNNADNQIVTSGISGISFNNYPDKFVYPSLSFAGSIFLEPISKGLVSTSSIFILEEFLNPEWETDKNVSKYLYERPNDETKKLVFTLNNDNIRFFNVDENLQTVNWVNKVIFDLSDNPEISKNTPLQLNIGFVGEDEGVYEEILNIYISENGKYTLIGEIVITAEAIGEDERLRTIFSNFGVPDPISYPHLFKEANINESNIDYNLVNKKSKELFLEYSNIFPFVGTYKALINAIKFLGYDDISFREWFLNIYEQRYNSYLVSYDASERAKTILNESIEKRIGLKKLNKLSMLYKINKETGEVDKFGIPETVNVYDYNNEEVLLKLFYLKKWLEDYIIGINCRIIDITGEGIYYERYDNQIYATGNTSFDVTDIHSLTPYTIESESELIDGSANIHVSLNEFNNVKISDFIETPISSFIDYIYDNETNKNIDISDYDYYNPNQLVVSAPVTIPTLLNEYQVKCSINTTSATLITNLTEPLWIYDNEIKFYHNDKNETKFGYDINGKFDYSKLPTIQLEEAYLRDIDSKGWNESIHYSIKYDQSTGYYIITDVKHNKISLMSYDYITLLPEKNSSLSYTSDNIYEVPMFIINKYSLLAHVLNTTSPFLLNSDDENNFIEDKPYILDILNGRIINKISDNKLSYINFVYDNSSTEQSIKTNFVYTSDKKNFYIINPSEYLLDSSITINKINTINVNNIGNYYIEAYGWNEYNNVFYNKADGLYNVYMNQPQVYIYTVQNNTNNSSTFYNENILGDIDRIVSRDYILSLYNNDSNPLFEQTYRIDNLSVNRATPTGDPWDLNPNEKGPIYFKYPSISYLYDTPKNGDKCKFINLTEECYVDRLLDPHISRLKLKQKNISSQKFHIGDSINVVFYDKSLYQPIGEYENKIIDIIDNTIILETPINDYEDKYVYEAEAPGSSMIALHHVYSHDNDKNLQSVMWEEPIITYNESENEHEQTTYLLRPNVTIFIQNITEYKVTNLVPGDYIDNEPTIYLELDNDSSAGNLNSLFLKDQIVKLIYKSIPNEDDPSGNIEYYGSTSYKYIGFSNGNHILKGSFNTQLLESLVNKYPQIQTIERETIDLITNKKIKIAEEVNVRNLFDFIYISYAHQAFVDYEINASYSNEDNGYVQLFVNDNNFYSNYIDNTFSLINLEFKPSDAYELWMSYYTDPSGNILPDIIIKEDASLLNWVYTGIVMPNGKWGDLRNVYYRNKDNRLLYKVRYMSIEKYLPIYKYEIPITIDPNQFYDFQTNKHSTYNIVIDAVYNSDNYIAEQNNIWKVYNNNYNNPNLLFKVLNKSLFLSIEKEGIYDVNLLTYDKFGNIVEQNKEGLFKL